MTSGLVERAQRGDHEAFDALATAAYHRLYAVSRRILRDGYAAEDVVQETLIRAWRDLRGLREPERFDAWLQRLLIRACQDHVRGQRRRPLQVPVLDVDGPVAIDEIARLADRDELERAFLELSVEHRAVLVLTHYVGLPAPEIAEILGIPPGTVYSRLHYAIRAMRVSMTRSGSTRGAGTRMASPDPEHGR
ncbi:MAG: RNA polymerase sigma factor [Candidatus Limnocylindrales bacterium]